MVTAREKAHYEEWAQFAATIAEASGEIVRKYFRSGLAFERKADLSPVTKADQEVETFLRHKIKLAYPNHGIIGEEFGKEGEEHPVQWIIDPIDGTKCFIAGAPLFGTLIGIFENGIPVAGIIHQAISRETWKGYKGGNASLNNKPITTQQKKIKISDSILCSTAPELVGGINEKARFDSLNQQVYFTRFGLDCYAAGLVAGGYVDFMIEAKLQLYDYAGLVPVIEAAGGIVSDWNGNPLTLDCLSNINPRGHFLASGNASLHEQALKLLQA